MTRLGRRSLLAAGTATVAAPAVARGAEARRSWRMITSWPRDLPGPGVNARRLAERITAMSGGRLTVQLHAAGELVPGLQVFDAVNAGVAEMGHTASIYWTGKTRAAAYFTTVPWGLTPIEHIAWIEHGGGQALWDELYAPFNLKPLMAGSSGMQMGGWFRREIKTLADLRGLKVRAVGLSADIFQRLGAIGVVLPAGEIFPALQNGTVDGVEFLGPNSDRAQGFYQVAPYYYWPTFTKPNGTAECIVRRDAWEALEPDLKAIVAEAAR
ncbi:MAG TPA: TRAP transporter substrate-binding protein, partial [Geminicoccaceae bacterium]